MILVFTGNGKGKTTAAIGQSLRALGSGFSVCFCQFLKKGDFSEIKALQKLQEIYGPDMLEIHQFGSGNFIYEEPDKLEYILARKGWKKIESAAKKQFNLIVADELNTALNLGILKKERVCRLLSTFKEQKQDFISTGRGAPEYILELADLISRINPEKHYFEHGEKAEAGREY